MNHSGKTIDRVRLSNELANITNKKCTEYLFTDQPNERSDMEEKRLSKKDGCRCQNDRSLFEAIEIRGLSLRTSV